MVGCHESSLIRQGGTWTLIESAEVTRARTALAAESRFTSALLDATSAFVVTIDPEGRVVRCNRTCEDIAGRPRNEIEGRYLWESFGVSRSEVLERLARVWEAGDTVAFDAKLPCHDGRELIVAWSVVAVTNGHGGGRYIVATGQDVTSERRAHERLQDAYEAEHRIACTLQESLLRPVPVVEKLDIGVVYRTAFETAQVGGDFYDVFELTEDDVVFMVGDVSGKGVDAAGFTETVRSTLRTLVHVGLGPAEALSRGARILLQEGLGDQFATVGIGTLDAATGVVRYSSAGHPAPAIAAMSASTLIDVPTGPPLGTYPYTYEETVFGLGAGECLVLYTDGVTEARHGSDLLGAEGLLDHLSRAPADPTALADGLLEAAERHARGRLSDDVAIVALSLKREAASERTTA
ncbi:MAG: SpoIIE family protein phosphatase [Coriobacteriia bacterium]|nr:SpoIIE family protein phosphatase [Coriobacteriia bacterium]